MKKIILSLCAVLTMSLSLFAQHKASNAVGSKTLVVYFSATGTTKTVAQKIAKATGGTLATIEPTKAYTAGDLDWTNAKSRSTIEMKNPKARPACKKINTEGYTTIYLGYPIWWNEAPREVNTFIESSNLKGKKIIPFATSGGSGIANSVKVLKQTYPALQWQNGKLLNNASQKEIDTWVK